MALNTAIRLSAEERAWAYHLSMDRAEADYRNGIKYARLDALEEGRKEGIAIGEQRGRKVGREETRLEDARRIVASGKLTPEEVVAILGLSPEEVEQLATADGRD